MAKRGAEDQITRDDPPVDRNSDDEDPGVRSSELRPIAGRQVRGLPKRKGLGATASAPASAAPAAPPAALGGAGSASAFAGFGGFGAGGSSNGGSGSTPAATPAAPASAFGGFSFKPATPASAPTPAPAPAAEAPKPAFGGFSFGRPAAAPTPAAPAETTSATTAPKSSFAGFSFNKPAEPSKPAAAPASTPTFFGGSASVESPAAPAGSIASAPAAKSSAPAAPAATAKRSSSGAGPSQATPPAEDEVAYYTSLRGLNTAFLSFLSQSLNSNEFLDLTTVLPSLLSQYETYLREAESKAGWKPQRAAAEVNGAVSAPPVTTAPAATGSSQPPKTSAPASTTTGFSFKPAAAPAPAEATPKKQAPSAVNQFINDAIDETEKKDAEPEKPKEAPKFSFGATPAKSGSSLFTFAPSAPLHPTTPESKTFAPSTTTPVQDPPAKLGKFGPDGSTPQLSFGGAKSTPAGSTSPTKGGFSFGSSSGASAGFNFGTSSDKPAEKSATSGAFGSAKPFSFGSSTETASKPPTPFQFGSSAAAPPTSSFSFTGGAPASSTAPSAEASTTETPAEPAEFDSTNLADAIGQGEEDEETVVEQRSKLHELVDSKFKVVGVGQFKVKRSKDGSRRRLLMRADGSGKILLNMAMGASFKPTAKDKNVQFLGVDLSNEPKAYLLRVKTDADATRIVKAMEEEIAKIR